jgi:FlaG/FlaF family flagellin (archaellin)
MRKRFKKEGNQKFFQRKANEGLSPTVTTVLLIALTIVITLIIFLWFRGMVEEGVTKFGKNIGLVCDDIQFDVSYDSGTGTISIVNTGNVPLFRVNIKTDNNGNYQTKDIKEFSEGSSWPTGGLAQGGTFSGNIGSEIGSVQKITVLPVLIGTSSKGKKTFICGGQYGKEIVL